MVADNFLIRRSFAEYDSNVRLKEIDFLRGLCLLVILIYHFNSTWIPAGYRAVDIFFVLSGFLITSFTNKKILNGSFSYTQYLIARWNRLIPTLSAMIALCLIAGLFWLTPFKLSRLVHESLAGQFFFLNFQSAIDFSYFEPKSQFKPLLHLWSIAIEAQWYLLWPFVLMYFNPATKKGLIFTVSLTAASMLIFVLKFPSETAKFYLLPGRWWEFSAGGFAAIFQLKQNRAVRICGIAAAALAVALLFFNAESFALASTFIDVGIVLLILLFLVCGPRFELESFNNIMAPVRLAGEMCYSIYLWHWPILYFLRHSLLYYYVEENLSIIYWFALAAVSSLSFIVIEKPAHRAKKNKWQQILLFAFPLAPLCLIVLTLSRATLPFNYPEVAHQIFRNTDTKEPLAVVNCPGGTIGSIDDSCLQPKDTSLMIWGDSHAELFYHLAARRFESAKVSVHGFQQNGCLPTFREGQCGQLNAHALKFYTKFKPKILLLVGYVGTPERAQSLLEYLNKKSPETHLIVLTDPVVLRDDPTDLLYELIWFKKLSSEQLRGFRVPISMTYLKSEVDVQIWEKLPKVTKIPIQKIFCTSDACQISDSDSPNLLLFKDFTHSSELGAKMILNTLAPQIDLLLKQQEP